MKKRMIAAVLLVAMALGLLCACGDKVIQQEEAQKIALKAAGFSQKEVTDIHVHLAEQDGQPCFSVHFSHDGHSYAYLISATGEIISGGQGEHGH